MPGQNIGNNIRLILDMIDYNEYIVDDSFVLFVDFYKAFDTVSHQFMLKTIKCFGFGEQFLKAIQTLYRGCNSSVKLAHGTTPRFEVGRGIRQGCPLSPFLFLLVTQIMARHIKNAQFQGILTLGTEFKISQLADDTALFLRNKHEVIKAIDSITKFSEVSGLRMNLNKSALLSLKECDLSVISGIPVKNTITYLGVIIDKNEKRRCNLNFDPIVEKIRKRFNIWLMRDLSLNGRVLLSKAEGISRAVYLSLSMGMPASVYKKLDKILFNFIWRNRSHYLRKDILCNLRKDGGLEVLTFETLSSSFLVRWLSNLIKEAESIWNTFPKQIFDSLGGLNLLLKCDFKIEKLPVKLANFHKHALLAWKMVYKHNFSPTNCYIWNNRNIQYKNKSIYYQRWVDNNILLVEQLMNTEGQLLTYDEFLSKAKFPVSPKEYAIVFDAVPRNIIQILKYNSTDVSGSYLTTQEIFLGDIDITTKKCPNKYIRNLMHTKTLPAARSFWASQFEEINWERMWLIGDKFLLNNKIKEVSYKIVHRIYPAKKTLKRFKIDIEYSCTFCGNYDETICHLFYGCIYSKIFWRDVENYIRRKTGQTLTLKGKDVFIYFEDGGTDKDFSFFVQLFLVLGKFHIHKMKWAESKPNFKHLLAELKQYNKRS
uniref:Reverse transcriptase domain-containing protein n=1 Tax=Cyprinus carpio TaxID=7962 RepID=A0A8C1Z089_CYPCA